MTPPIPEVLAAVELPVWHEELRGMKPGPGLYDEQQEWVKVEDARAYGEACRTLKPGGSSSTPRDGTLVERIARVMASNESHLTPDSLVYNFDNKLEPYWRSWESLARSVVACLPADPYKVFAAGVRAATPSDEPRKTSMPAILGAGYGESTNAVLIPEMIREALAHKPWHIAAGTPTFEWLAERLNNALSGDNTPCPCCGVTPQGEITDAS